jgi:hypothetical protein
METPCVPTEGWVVYTVLPGETLFSIAARYGMSTEELQQANCLSSGGALQAGQNIYIPYLIPSPPPGGGGLGGGEPELLTGLKEEIFFDPGGGGDLPDCGTPEPGTPLPAVTISDRLLEFYRVCVHGFPLDEEVTVKLYAPAGHLVGSSVYEFEGELEGRTAITVYLWWPVGLETGAWRVVAHSATETAENTFEIDRPAEPETSTTSPGDINPFEWHFCDDYAAGEAVVIRGSGFEPNGVVRLGIYRNTATFSDEGLVVQSLVRQTSANTDAGGAFATIVVVEASDPSGSYAVIPVTNPTVDWYDWESAAISCYEVP